jgi:hypothetical protein
MSLLITKTSTYGREVRFHTDLAPDAVYDYLSDFQKHREWAEELANLEATSANAGGVGTTYKTLEVLRPGSRVKSNTFCEITALERPSLIEWRARTEATKGPMAMRSHWAFRISPDGDGSTVVQSWAMEPPNVFSAAFLRFFVALADGLMGGAGASPKNVAKHAAKLKTILDQKAAG